MDAARPLPQSACEKVAARAPSCQTDNDARNGDVFAPIDSGWLIAALECTRICSAANRIV